MRALAKSNVQVLGWQPLDILEEYMTKARAFVYAACEDFGIALVEAQACGVPVIAYQQGGAAETVKDIRNFPQTGTGLLFSEQTVDSIVSAVKTFEQYQNQITVEQCCLQASKFSPTIFKKSYLEFVDQYSQKFPN